MERASRVPLAVPNHRDLGKYIQSISMNQKRFINILLILIILILIGTGGYLLLMKQTPPLPQEQSLSQSKTQKTQTQPKTQKQEAPPLTPQDDETASWTRFQIGAGGGGEGGLAEIPTKITFKYPQDLLVECAPTGPFPNLISRDLDPQKCWYQINEVSPPSFVAQLGSLGDEASPPVLDLKKWRVEDWAPDYRPNEDTVLKEGFLNGMNTLEERTPTKVTTYLATGTGRVFSFSYYPITEANETLYQQILSTFNIEE